MSKYNRMPPASAKLLVNYTAESFLEKVGGKDADFDVVSLAADGAASAGFAYDTVDQLLVGGDWMEILSPDFSPMTGATLSTVVGTNQQAGDMIPASPNSGSPDPRRGDHPLLIVDDTADHVLNATEAARVEFSVEGVGAGAAATVSFADAANHRVFVNVTSDGNYSADLASLSDGTITSQLSVTDPAGNIVTAAGIISQLETDSALTPTLLVNAANPTDVTFTVAGLESDYSGTVTFTDSTGRQDVVPIGADGNYSANLSNLMSGSLTYLMSVTDPAGNTLSIDPTVTLGDGSANAPAGSPQLPNLLNGYVTRPSWEVAGVDYAVGPAAGTVFMTPSASNLPSGASMTSWGIDVTGANVTLNGYDLTNKTVMIEASASGTITISNCTSSQNVNIRSVVGATANLIVENSILNGGGTASDPNYQTIQVWCPLTAQYNYILNSPAAIGAEGDAVTIQYNLMQAFDWNPPDHANAIYISGPTPSALVQYNTIWTGNTQNLVVNNTPTPIGLGAAIAGFTDWGSITNTQITNNTVIASLPGGASYLIGLYTYGGAQGFTASGSIQNNYVASLNGFNNSNSGAFGAFYPDLTKVTATFTGNVDMATGKVVNGDNTETGNTSSSGITQVVISPSNGDLNLGKTVTIILNLSAAVTVVGGTPTLTLNDGGVATYIGGSGTSALAFSYTVASGQNTASLAATAINLNGATVQNGAGTAANLSLTGLAQTGPQIDTITPAISSVVESPSTGDLGAGKTVTFTLNLSDAVTVAGGTPTLILNDAGTATYTGGSGSSALTFSYTVSAGQNTAALAATGISLNGATVKNGAGTPANLSLTGLTQVGPQIDTLSAGISSIVESPASGVLNAGKTVTLTFNLSSAVTVAGGTPTLTLNDGGTATYAGGSGTSALTFSYTVAAGQNTASLAATAVNLNGATVKDGSGVAANMSLTGLSQTGPQINTTIPAITSIFETPASGDLNAGKTVTLKLTLSSAVAVAGATPTLTLNDGGTATYTGGSGTSALTFNYTVAAGQNTAALAATAINLNGATVQNGAGTPANLSLTGLTQIGPQIDTLAPSAPIISSDTISKSGAVTLTGTAEANNTVTVYNGGTQVGTLIAAAGAWSFTTDSLSSGTYSFTANATDPAGNPSGISSPLSVIVSVPPNLVVNGGFETGSFSGWTQSGNTTWTSVTGPPHGGQFAASVGPGSTDGVLSQGIQTVAGQHYTLDFWLANEAGGGPNDFTVKWNGTALLALVNAGAQSYTEYTYDVVGIAGTSQLEFDFRNDPAQWALDGISVTQVSPGPAVVSIAESPANADLGIGKTVTLTLNLSAAVAVAGGTPTLTLNDGGVATYTGGSGTSALTFSYTAAAGQNTAALAATAVNLNGATVTNGAGTAASLSLSGLTQAGPQIDTTTPAIASIVESPASGDFGVGKTVTLTLNLSEAVAVAGGTPTLTLNDGGVATYTGGSGTSALTFSYTVGAGQNTAALAATAVNLNGATVKNGAGTAASLSLSGLTQAGPQIDTTTPAISSIVETPASGDFGAGKTVTLTLKLGEAVTVAGGTPTLTLNDGGVATYTGGSGTSALTFSYTVASGQNTAALAATAVNLNGATVQNGAGTAASLSLTGLTQAGPQIDTTAPTVTQTTAVPVSGTENPGDTITITIALTKQVTVTGTPTLGLNDGAVATYTGGSGTNALTFKYTVGATDSTVAALAVTQINLPNGATVKDAAGNAANLTGALTTFTGLAIDPPVIATSLLESPASGDLNAGKTVTLTLNLNGAVTVAGGTPKLTLNDGGVATYTGGSGTSALTFSYTVASGQNTAALAATAVNLNGSTILDGLGNAANLSLSGLTQTGPQIDTVTPAIASIMESPASGDLGAGKTVTLTLNLSEAVTVAGGTPTLTLNDGGVATYAGGSGTSALTFSYTVASGQNTAALAATAVNLNGATVQDGAGNSANLALTGLTQTGPQIDTATAAITSIVDSPASGDLNAGKTVTLTLNLSKAVTVAGGTPTLVLNDGGTATYSGGSGTSALTFSYTVGAGQNTAALAATAVNLNGATVKDGAGSAANLALTGLTQTGPQIDTTLPTVTQVLASPASGTDYVGKTITLTLDMSKAVTVTGTPTLTLNDGGTATYAGGSGTNALTFSYTVWPSDSSVPALAITQVNLPGGATVADLAGNAANLAAAVTTLSGVQIDTTTPAVMQVLARPWDYGVGATITLTLAMSKPVTVTGTPTLTLNDGGTATYTGGSGTNVLTFGYTVGASDTSVSALAITQVNLPNGATIQGGSGNGGWKSWKTGGGGSGVAANLSGALTTLNGLQIDTITPTVTQVVASPGTGTAMPGDTVRLTLDLNDTVKVSGTPVLLLNDGGTATYSSGSGSNALTFTYTVSTHDATVPVLGITQVNLPNGATVQNGAGTNANLAGALTNLSGLAIDPPDTTPAVTQVIAAPGSGHTGIGSTIKFMVGLDEAVNVSGGTPILTVNDGGAAIYDAAATKALDDPTKLVFNYTVGARDTGTSALAITGAILNVATIADAAGHNANLSMVSTTFAGLQVDAPLVAASLFAKDPQADQAGLSGADPSVIAAFHQYVASAFGSNGGAGTVPQLQTGSPNQGQLLIPAFKAAKLLNA